MSRVFISFGSNLGDKVSNCKRAVHDLAAFADVIHISSLYETEPVGKEDQPDFINGVVELDTDLSPHELLAKINSIEDKLGRVRKEKWGPRIIDLDIIFFDDVILEDKDLKIPHPMAHLRRFVLEPLCEITPEFMHPVYKKSAKKLLDKIDDDKGVVRLNESAFSQP